jgi:MoaA/NifB/PqqE/SkfB family radical SAM enzyme
MAAVHQAERLSLNSGLLMSADGSPPKVYFEVTSRCNLRCEFCAMSESRREPQDMPFRLFTRGMDEISEARISDTVGFHGFGEPLL